MIPMDARIRKDLGTVLTQALVCMLVFGACVSAATNKLRPEVPKAGLGMAGTPDWCRKIADIVHVAGNTRGSRFMEATAEDCFGGPGPVVVGWSMQGADIEWWHGSDRCSPERDGLVVGGAESFDVDAIAIKVVLYSTQGRHFFEVTVGAMPNAGFGIGLGCGMVAGEIIVGGGYSVVVQCGDITCPFPPVSTVPSVH